jgi:hypothetical protein
VLDRVTIFSLRILVLSGSIHASGRGNPDCTATPRLAECMYLCASCLTALHLGPSKRGLHAKAVVVCTTSNGRKSCSRAQLLSNGCYFSQSSILTLIPHKFRPQTIWKLFIACATLSLRAIFLLSGETRPPHDLGPPIWSRIWPWIYFMQEHRGHDLTFYGGFLAFVGRMYINAKIYDVSCSVSSTLGFRVVLEKA